MNFKHGHKTKKGASRLYRIHHNIIQRCHREKCPEYKYYGGRGITLHEPWHDFATFIAEIPPYPTDGKKWTLDRIDNNKGYEPDNLRWSDMIEQANNKRNNHYITFEGKTQSLAMWARELGINYNTLKSRINQSKMPPEKAFKTLRRG